MDIDFKAIESIFETAGDMGSATGKAANGLAAIKSLFQRSEAGADPKIERALGELAAEIAHAQVANAELKFQLATLKDQLAKLQATQADLDRYELWKTPTGAFVYRCKEEERGAEPVHYLCPNCIDQKRKSILQGHAHWRECSVCKAGFTFDESPPRDPIVRVRKRFDYP